DDIRREICDFKVVGVDDHDQRNGQQKIEQHVSPFFPVVKKDEDGNVDAENTEMRIRFVSQAGRSIASEKKYGCTQYKADTLEPDAGVQDHAGDGDDSPTEMTPSGHRFHGVVAEELGNS